MSRFKKKGGSKLPAISTASLPDIVFMLLFFFMVTTTIRSSTIMVKQRMPNASEIQKLEKKSLVSYIYCGTPNSAAAVAKLGPEPRIQLNDAYAEIADIGPFIELEKKELPEVLIPKMTVSLKVDKGTKMGIVTDIKQELRKANALKINYSSIPSAKRR